METTPLPLSRMQGAFVRPIYLLLVFVAAVHAAWYKGQLHCHSNKSDGSLSPEALVSLYQGYGYHFVVVTDHNQVTNTTAYRTSTFLTLPGAELDDEMHVPMVHLNAINVQATSLSAAGRAPTMQDLINLAIDNGAIPQLNHPDWSNFAPPRVLLYPTLALMEVIQPSDELAYDASVWDAALSGGQQIYGTGTDDLHGSNGNRAWIVVQASSLTIPNVVTAIRSGNFYASQGPTITEITMSGRTLSVTSSNGAQVQFVGKDGTVLSTVNLSSASHTLAAGGLYVRARVTDAGGKVAYTQAYFPATTAVAPAPVAHSSRAVPSVTSTGGQPAVTYAVKGQAWQKVSITVHDMQGRLVRTLANTWQAPGTYRKAWDWRDDYCREVSSGTYAVRLTVGGEAHALAVRKH